MTYPTGSGRLQTLIDLLEELQFKKASPIIIQSVMTAIEDERAKISGTYN